MSRPNRGKDFERCFQRDWKRCFPETFILRLKDDTSGYRGSSKNPCDFLCLPDNKLYMIETKTHYGNTFPLSAFSQYDELMTYKDCNNVEIGVILWFLDHQNSIVYIPLSTFTKLKNDNKKSFNVKMIGKEDYPNIIIPSIKKRVFYVSDYRCLVESTESHLDIC